MSPDKLPNIPKGSDPPSKHHELASLTDTGSVSRRLDPLINLEKEIVSFKNNLIDFENFKRKNNLKVRGIPESLSRTQSEVTHAAVVDGNTQRIQLIPSESSVSIPHRIQFVTDQQTGQKIQILTAVDQSGASKRFILANNDSSPSKVILARQDSSQGKVYLTTPDAAGVNQLFISSPDVSAQHIQILSDAQCIDQNLNKPVVELCVVCGDKASVFSIASLGDTGPWRMKGATDPFKGSDLPRNTNRDLDNRSNGSHRPGFGPFVAPTHGIHWPVPLVRDAAPPETRALRLHTGPTIPGGAAPHNLGPEDPDPNHHLPNDSHYRPVDTSKVGGRLLLFRHAWLAVVHDEWVRDLVSSGYKINFFSPRPLSNPVFRCPPSRSGKTRPCFFPGRPVALTRRSHHRCPSGRKIPWFLLNLFMVPKKDGTVRPFLDLKLLNGFVKVRHFRMESLCSVIASMEHGEFLASIDIRDAYLHIPIFPPHQRFFRFAVGEEHFKFRALPLGLATAPRVFTKVMAAVMAILHSRGLVFLPYLDDLLVKGPSLRACEEFVRISLDTLSRLGWLINLKKSSLLPAQRISFLGMTLDTSLGLVLLPRDKVLALQQGVWKLLRPFPCSIRFGMRILGKNGRPIRIQSDNATAVAYINQGGTRSRAAMREVEYILRWAEHNHSVISAVNIPGVDNWAADFLSRQGLASGAWSLHQDVPSPSIAGTELPGSIFQG
ncbi:unnamed protein product [Ranitomeya imitator]|uniref:ribonuclease H n=1 Tax=Ranitomeya imitator TaxID=111125 RepID=A0ABN9M1I6_9NEOB|nr:unnamed protein product [Ranitomeya imitator]